MRLISNIAVCTATLLLAGTLAVTVHAAAPAVGCDYAAPRSLQLDLAGVQSVRVEVRGHQLRLHGGAGDNLTLSGRACASSRSALTGLTVTQRRVGSQLRLDLASQGPAAFHLSADSYAYLTVTVRLPASVPVVLEVGSGTVDVAGMQQLDAGVSSGGLLVRDVGRLYARVGSGTVKAAGVAMLEVAAVGSGDFKASGIRGDVRVGHVGSGVVQLRGIDGNVRVDTIGSGRLEVDAVGGDFSLGSRGSGTVVYSDVRGKASVPQRGQ